MYALLFGMDNFSPRESTSLIFFLFDSCLHLLSEIRIILCVTSFLLPSHLLRLCPPPLLHLEKLPLLAPLPSPNWPPPLTSPPGWPAGVSSFP